MPREKSAANYLSVSEIRKNLAEILNQVAYGGTRIVLGRRGREIAALVPIADLEALKKSLLQEPSWKPMTPSGVRTATATERPRKESSPTAPVADTAEVAQKAVKAVAKAKSRQSAIPARSRWRPRRSSSFWRAQRAMQGGDFAVRLPLERGRAVDEIARAFNAVMGLNETLTDEIVRVERVVGREGRMTERAPLGDVRGGWATKHRLHQRADRRPGAADHRSRPRASSRWPKAT